MNVKIIIMLRNPTDRAYSAFQHVSRGFKEQNSFEEALTIEEGRMDKESSLTPMVMYKEMGLYHDMVRAYKENFKDVFSKHIQKVDMKHKIVDLKFKNPIVSLLS